MSEGHHEAPHGDEKAKETPGPVKFVLGAFFGVLLMSIGISPGKAEAGDHGGAHGEAHDVDHGGGHGDAHGGGGHDDHASDSHHGGDAAHGGGGAHAPGGHAPEAGHHEPGHAPDPHAKESADPHATPAPADAGHAPAAH